MISGERESWERFYSNCTNFSDSLWFIWCYSFLICRRVVHCGLWVSRMGCGTCGFGLGHGPCQHLSGRFGVIVAHLGRLGCGSGILFARLILNRCYSFNWKRKNPKTFYCSNHRHLRNIDCLMVRTACLVCFISTVHSCIKKEKKNPIKTSASSGHITNLKQSILETFDIYGSNSYLYVGKDQGKNLPRFETLFLVT
jgi:hypothetical protein